MAKIRGFTERDRKVLAMMQVTADKVSKISEPVDPHKRFQANDYKDPYGRVIEWVHFTGTGIFLDK
jgi:hypothetical protein